MTTALVVPLAMGLQIVAPAAHAAAGPVGSGFTVSTGDLAFILKQIKISERHSLTRTPAQPCSTLVNQPNDGIPDAEQVPDILTSFGLRTVDGSCNNLKAGDGNFGAADQVFPRLTNPKFRAAENLSPFGPPGPTSYAQKKGNVVDSQPRTISNLIVDQTSTNPAAIAAAGFPVRTQGNPGLFPCTTDPDPGPPEVVGVPAGCVPSHHTLFIPNVTTDVGLSPPYNSLFTFFGQFFDHGVDQTVKSGASVFVPLKADDPLRLLGPDGKPGTGDEVPASQAFMVLTRAQNQPGPDGVLGDNPATPADESADDIQNATNTDTPWVDQSQTYTSHASHQVFTRAFVPSSLAGPFGANNPKSVPTGKFLEGLPAGQTYAGSPDGTEGIGSWAAVKKQAAELLGLRLVDTDSTKIPMLATDPYGKFIPGPARGLPQYVTRTGLVEGNLAAPVLVPANVVYFDTPFLTDLAHNADPSPQDTDHNPATPPVAPTPDANDTPSADFASQPPGTYDDELLNSHFVCGDGRCNENIALSTIHQVFHSEHNRLVDNINQILTSDTSAAGIAALASWRAIGVSGYNYGERLFQAARFITEMEYQHLVFEEFARKVQPGVRLFHLYSPDINPAVEAEFAHAVYRFGHSMLDDDVARTNGNGSDNSVPLLTAFLNPPELFNGGSVGTLGARAGAGSVVMGSSDQVGNELDEFVVETLRNNLLGLPLDLPAINMTRAREAGIPPLNDVRRQIFAESNDGQMTPYTSWSDFGQHLKHPESLINFVAAYGLHPSVTGATTLVDKRNAARAIVDPQPSDVPPGDASDFMFSTGAWSSNAAGVTNTGLDDVDLWVGGLSEITNVFGGLLGSTFNYVFQSQLEKLQDGDRFYYLARTPGLNMRAQLEGNSFSELIQRNTDNTNTLKADAFATADCKFQLANLAGTPAGFTANGSTVADDPTTDCDESALLLRKPDGTIQYRQFNSVDPSGINGQGVYQGTDGPDRVFGGNDNDTFWGGLDKDVIEGNGGDDVALGGEGNDILTDLSGADVLKGGPGNDAIDTGIGDDISMGGDGQDFINGGAQDNEHFAGPGNDFIIAGQGADAVFGDGGDDWIEGGSGQDLLQGDHSAPFFDDPGETAPGNEIFVGQVGENDYDAEGGDDLMSANAAVDRNAGAAGFDWAFHQYDTVGADEDMNINNNLDGLVIQAVVNRDRWQEVEGNSGSAFNDIIKGTDDAPTALGGAGFAGCNALDQAGVDRITGLNVLVPPSIMTTPSASLAANAAAGRCPLTGNVWGDGEILIGGGGSDTITGRGANDIMDGDRSLNVRIDVHANADGTGAVIGTTDLMEHSYLAGNPKTLQQAVFDGTVDAGQLVMARALQPAPVGDRDASSSAASPTPAIDTAVFLGPRASYTITTVGDHLVVDQTGALGVAQKISDGTDTLRNFEQGRFTNDDGTTETVVLNATTPGAPTIGTATAGLNSASVTWTAPASNGGSPITGYTIVAVNAANAQVGTASAGPGATSGTVTGLAGGVTVRLRVAAVNAVGTGAFSALSNAVTPTSDTVAPTVTARSPAPNANGVSLTTTVTATFSEPVVGVSGTTFTLRAAALNVPATVTIVGNTATLTPTSPLVNNNVYTVTLTGGAGAIRDTSGNPLATTTWTFRTLPDTIAPTVITRSPAPGATGVPVNSNVVVTFSERVTLGANAFVLRNAANNAVLAIVTLSADGRTATLNPVLNLPAGQQFTVTLNNQIRDTANNQLVPVTWTFRT